MLLHGSRATQSLHYIVIYAYERVAQVACYTVTWLASSALIYQANVRHRAEVLLSRIGLHYLHDFARYKNDFHVILQQNVGDTPVKRFSQNQTI